MLKQTYSRPKRKKRTIILIIVILVILACAFMGIHWYMSSHKSKITESGQTTSKLATAQSNYTSGQARKTSTSSIDQGGVVATSGSSSTTGTSKKSVSSTSGAVTLNSPTSGDTIQSGVVLTGMSTVDTVQFRLVDDKSGVIAQGQLNVSNGSFSGTLSFKPYGTTGQLDVFSYDTNSGAEINSIKIPVNF